MKKLIFLPVILFFALPIVKAQKADTKPVRPASLNLVTPQDSISYAIGLSLFQGLPQYLVQLGVLADTANISLEYRDQIEIATDQAMKQQLEKELKVKLDSARLADEKNLEIFIKGLQKGLFDTDNKVFNSGLSIAAQLSAIKNGFTEEMMEEPKDFNVQVFASAITGSLKGEKPKIDDFQTLLQNASLKAQAKNEAKRTEKLKKQYKHKIAEGEKFMQENKAKKGVVTLPSGLQYEVLVEGTGEKPKATDRVTVHYTGTLQDGTVFDSSVQRGEPTTFGVGQVIKGWTEALQLMPVGSKWKIYIPYDLAYGSADQGAIKPFSNLIFEVELLDIAK